MGKAILFFTSELDGLSLDLYRKVQSEAKNRGIQLLTYCAGPLHSGSGDIKSESKIYDYIESNSIDGVIVNGGAIGQFSPMSHLESFVRRFINTTVVSLSYPINSAVNITVDNYKGIYDLIDHLINSHNYRKIGFVKGPEGHPEAEERLKAYKDALKNNSIRVDEALIAPGDFSEEAGIAAVKQFVDGGSKVEAIACVDDDSALGVFLELKRRNIKCPREIAVTGFDDIITAEKLIPSLTTVAQPYDEMITKAFDTIINKESSNKIIPTIGVLRESCGCRDKDITESSKLIEGTNDFNQSLELLKKSDFPISGADKNRLIEALKEEFNNDKDFAFTDELSMILEGQRSFSPIHSTLSIINKLLPMEKKSISIMQQARVLVNKISNRICSLDRLSYEGLTSSMNSFILKITQSESEDALFNLLVEGMPQFECDECHLIKVTNSEAKIIFTFKNGRIGSNPKDSFNPQVLLPKGMLDPSKNYTVLPLSANANLYGYAVYAFEGWYADILGALNTQISGEINRHKLLYQRNREKIQLEERNSAIQNLIMPMLDLIKQVTNDSQNEIAEMKEIKQKVEENNKSFAKTLDMLNMISDKIDSVMKSVSVINDISENVNVLAINTSIQSAHAGDYGKAFGVIAKEIRKLSDSTALNAKTISDDLKETINEFRNFKDINRDNVDTFKGFSNQINHFMDVFNNIASKMETLSSSSLNIIDIMEA